MRRAHRTAGAWQRESNGARCHTPGGGVATVATHPMGWVSCCEFSTSAAWRRQILAPMRCRRHAAPGPARFFRGLAPTAKLCCRSAAGKCGGVQNRVAPAGANVVATEPATIGACPRRAMTDWLDGRGVKLLSPHGVHPRGAVERMTYGRLSRAVVRSTGASPAETKLMDGCHLASQSSLPPGQARRRCYPNRVGLLTGRAVTHVWGR